MHPTDCLNFHSSSIRNSFLSWASLALAMACAVTVGGCASGEITYRGRDQSKESVEVRNIVVKVSSALEGMDKEILWVKALVISGLNDSNRFRAVPETGAASPPGNGVKVDVDIVEFRGVSQTAREVLGAFAGQAGIRLRVNVIEMTSGNQIRDFEAVGKSGISTFSGNTPEAVGLATQQIVDELLRLFKPINR